LLALHNDSLSDDNYRPSDSRTFVNFYLMPCNYTDVRLVTLSALVELSTRYTTADIVLEISSTSAIVN